MASIKFIATNHDKLGSINVKDGQIIFARDEQVIYLDSESNRVAFRNIITIDKEANRAQTAAIEGCFYYVEDSKLIYRYQDSQWNCLNSSEIIFSDRNSFPEQGDSSKLYATEDAIYKWDTQKSDYVKIGSGNIMSELN